MRSLLVSLVALGVALVCFSGAVADDDITITIKVSPNVINIANETTQWVTVHTDIPYGLVEQEDATVTLNGVPIDWSKTDECGNFVAKFVAGDVKDILEEFVNKEIDLTLSGTTIDGADFTGSESVRVISVKGGK